MRRYASLFLLWSFGVLLVTGVVLYLMPHGRVAYWTGWRLWGLDKDQWTALHLTFGVMMLVSGSLHLWLNWGTVKRYLGTAGKLFISREGLVSLLISAGLVFASVCNLPPSSTLVGVGERLKESWPRPVVKPPLPHAERLSLKRICLRAGVDPQVVAALLASQGMRGIDLDRSLKNLAEENHTSPAEIYRMILMVGEKANPGKSVERQGKR